MFLFKNVRRELFAKAKHKTLEWILTFAMFEFPSAKADPVADLFRNILT